MNSPLGRLQLATELISMIFKEIDNVDDAIMLGLTHDALMVIGWEHIRALLVQNSAKWAGTRIIIVGDQGDDVPEGLISEEEKEEWGRLYLKNVGEGFETLSLYEVFCWLHDGLWKDTSKDYQRPRRLSSKERSLAHTITKGGAYQYRSEKGWVLMNQTKKEYVTSMAASSILPSSMSPTWANCFGRLILCRICWSSDSSVAMSVSADLHRGVWAGDRFVIVTVDDFEAMPSAKGWKDVSVETAELLKEVLISEGKEY